MKQACTVIVAALLAAAAGLGFVTLIPLEEAEAAGGYVKTCSGGSIYLNDYENRTLSLHNQTRANNGLGALCVNEKLTNAARSHSKEMIDRDYFSHNSYNGETFSARIKRFGYYPYRAIGENIAWGSGSRGTPDSIFNGWMNSSGHKGNILNSNFKQIGVGTAYGQYKSYSGVTMYTVDFGTQ